MEFNITNIKASLSGERISFLFGVVPELVSRIELVTGEIFQHPNRAKLYKQEANLIGAELFVEAEAKNTLGECLGSEMRYHSGRGESASKIWFVWRATETERLALKEMILARHAPKSVWMEFGSDSIPFGWEPDGSSRKWNNSEMRSVPIESVRIDFEFQSRGDVGGADLELSASLEDVATYDDFRKVSYALIKRIISIESKLDRVSKAAIVTALVGVIFLVSYFVRLPT